jgi:lipopolysaccharide heptosyltransferase I
VKSVPAVRLSAIGDVVHAMPAVAALRRERPDVRITWVVERGAAALLRGSPCVDRLVEIDTRAWRRRLLRRETQREIAERLGVLRAGRFDVAVDFQGLLKSALVAYASGAPRRVGFAAADLREPASRAFLNEQVEVGTLPHVIEKNLALVRHLGVVAAGPYEFPVAVPEADERDVAARAPEAPFAILNPGGGWPTKLWPAERYGRLADELHARHGLVSVVTFGPGEEELARRVAGASVGGHASPFACSLLQFVALARRASLFVGGDTGPLHLAAAAGTRVVGIYGPTEPRRNGPFAPGDVVVGRDDLPCREDCYRRSCSHWECMEIPVESVQRAAGARLRTP